MPTGVGAGIRSREGREGAARAARRDGSLRSTPHPGYERDMPFLTHAGVSLRYDRAGSGPPVLLVHGWTCNRTFWERQVVALRDRHSPLLSWAVGQLQKTPPHVAEACFDALLAADLRAGLKKLKVPTAVLHGKHDALLPLAHGEDLAKKIPGAKLTVFAESGHAPFLEEPAAFNAALGTLLV